MEHSALSVALLRQRLVSMLRAMPAAQAGDEVSVHQARVASRRLREALPVLGAGAADAGAVDRAGRRVRRITRALGPVRELDVTLLLLAELEGKGTAPARGIARVRAAVGRRAAEAPPRHARRDHAVEARQAAQAARAGRRAGGSRPPRQRAMRSPKLRARRPARAEAPRPRSSGPAASISPIGCIGCTSRPRSCATRSRSSANCRHARATSRLGNRLKVQQDLLGRIHDLEVLIDHARGAQAALPRSTGAGFRSRTSWCAPSKTNPANGMPTYMRARPSWCRLCEAVIAAAGESTQRRVTRPAVIAPMAATMSSTSFVTPSPPNADRSIPTIASGR